MTDDTEAAGYPLLHSSLKTNRTAASDMLPIRETVK